MKWLSVLAKVPFGTVITYSELAQRWGNIKAARAAGQACQRNPLPIILPCHRVVRAGGKFDNYSGGDRENPRSPKNIYRKQWLIELETRKLFSYSFAQRSHYRFRMRILSAKIYSINRPHLHQNTAQHPHFSVCLSTSNSSLRVPDFVTSIAGKTRLSDNLRSRILHCYQYL